MHAVEGMACSQWIYHPADRNKTQWPYQNHHILPSICRTIRNLQPPTDSQPTGQTSTQSKPFCLPSHPQFKTSPTASDDNENTIDVIKVQPQHQGKRTIYNAQMPCNAANTCTALWLTQLRTPHFQLCEEDPSQKWAKQTCHNNPNTLTANLKPSCMT